LAQYSPQISGGNGRNINYVVDGGDNNDDGVGGLLQLFPLEAVQEFNVLTQRFDAEYGRSNGGVISVVTKSGTNERRGSWFTLGRDDGMNAKTFTERLAGVAKQPYERYQFGGSLGGPIILNRAHYFGAYESTRQNTTQVINTSGLSPADDGVFPIEFREHLLTAKATVSFSPRQFGSLRYARDHNTQPAGVAPNVAHSAWATSTNSFDSINLNHNWLVRSSVLNEAVVQYSEFVNDIPANRAGPSFIVGTSGPRTGSSAIAPQRTEQIKWQFRDDVSWTKSGIFGVSHELRAGVSWIHEPHLSLFNGAWSQGLYVLLQPDLAGPVMSVQFVANDPTSNFPLEQYGLYVQDDWRVSNRLTLNLGLRWDYVDGLPIDFSRSANFQAMQQAGAAGMFAGTLLDDFGKEPRPDRDNVQPRVGAAFDLFGDGRDVVRGGWGVYSDFGYVASNALTAGFDASNGGIVFSVMDPNGLRKKDGSFFHVGDPLESLALPNAATGSPSSGEVVSPRLEQPYTRQANLGWAHQLDASTVVSADYVRVDGRDLNMRVRPNVVVNPNVNPPARLLSGINISPNNSTFRTALSKGSSRYDALILAFRRRLSRGVDASASYTLGKATSDIGTASDEIAQNLIQDIQDPFGPVQQGPSVRTDSRHLLSLSAIVNGPWGVNVAPIFYYRSGLPMHTTDGTDPNRDSMNNDRTERAYRYTGIGDDNKATFEEDGMCETVSCSRRAPFSQMNLRISRAFPIARGVRIEAIAEIFNLFNARNPSLPLTQSRMVPASASPGFKLNPDFMQPTAYAGDVGQPEQRVGQIGFRITF
jgi:outer membrane receptor protein involved in Fe transport